jgi:hypothetical protein
MLETLTSDQWNVNMPGAVVIRRRVISITILEKRRRWKNGKD